MGLRLVQVLRGPPPGGLLVPEGPGSGRTATFSRDLPRAGGEEGVRELEGRERMPLPWWISDSGTLGTAVSRGSELRARVRGTEGVVLDV